jgi:phospholipase C
VHTRIADNSHIGWNTSVNKHILHCFTSKTVYELFEEAKLTWATYFHDFNEVLQFKALKTTPDHFRPFEERWKKDVASGDLANYSFILPRFLNKSATKRANSEHAPEDVRFGDNLIADVYDALAANNDLFNQSALIVTFDEHGGFYDHVAPPSAPNPDGQDSPNPDDPATFAPRFAFDRLGLRVPAIIASPWIPKGIVENRKLQHTSVIKTVTEIFKLQGPLNKRDASATSFANLFQTLSAPRPASDMPKKLPRPSVTDAIISSVAGIPVDPADEPLSSLTREWMYGILALTGAIPTLKTVHAPAAPDTQAEAARFVRQRLKAAFGI